MRTLSFKTRMIELASEINAEMPAFVVRKVVDALNKDRKALNGSRILVLGVAYKKDIDDLRESPALEIIRLLQDRGAEVEYHDPFCPIIRDDGHSPIHNLPLHSVALTDETLQRADAAVIVTDHTAVDYARVAKLAQVVVDTRGVLGNSVERKQVFGLSRSTALEVAHTANSAH
jgi:UDP-N-acetyl-D-glucosamine dehydrogenase